MREEAELLMDLSWLKTPAPAAASRPPQAPSRTAAVPSASHPPAPAPAPQETLASSTALQRKLPQSLQTGTRGPDAGVDGTGAQPVASRSAAAAGPQQAMVHRQQHGHQKQQQLPLKRLQRAGQLRASASNAQPWKQVGCNFSLIMHASLPLALLG